MGHYLALGSYPGSASLLDFIFPGNSGIFFIGPSNLVCVLLLWFYSTTFQKKITDRQYIDFPSYSLGNRCSYTCVNSVFTGLLDPEFHGALSRDL